MASCREFNYFDDWQHDEGDEEAEIATVAGEEEAGRLTRSEAWHSCSKLQKDVNYHQRYIPLKDVLGFRDLSNEGKEKIIKDKGLTDEDKLFLESEKGQKCLERFADAVVCVKVKSSYGTGFFMRMDELKNYEGDIVITNSHTIRKPASGNGSNFDMVQPSDVKVISFYNGTERGLQVPREVIRFGRISAPDKNKDKDILLRKTKAALYGDGTAVSKTAEELISLLDQLAPALSIPEGFLDYAILFLKPLESDEEKRKFAKVRPLEIKAKTTEKFRNVPYFELPHPEILTFPRSIRLFTISHPHRASKQVSFGAVESHLFHLYLLNQTCGQNDTDSLEEGMDPFAEHSVATCPGSSGAPIFVYYINHETGDVEIDEVAYFLHFFGSEVDGKLHGKAMSFGTIFCQLETTSTSSSFSH